MINFKQYLREHLKANNSVALNDVIRQELEERLVHKARRLTENSVYGEDELDVVTRLQVAARGFGSDTGSYVDGILTINLHNKQAALEFADVLDDDSDVEDYQLNALFNDRIKGYNQEIDIDDITDDSNITFVFLIELNPEITSVIDENEYDSYSINLGDTAPSGAWNPEQVSSMEWQPWMGESFIRGINEKFTFSVRGGKKVKRLVHAAGTKVVDGKAKVMTGAEKAQGRLSAHHAAITRKSAGAGAHMLSVKKLRKSLAKRKGFGLH